MKQVDMLRGSVWKSIVRFSVPMFLTYLIQLLYHTTDTLFVGRFLGTEVIRLGVSILRITFPLYFIYVFLQVFGDALRAMQHSFAVMLIILLNIGLLRVLLMYGLLHLYGTIQALVVVYPITWFTAAVSMAVLYIIQKRNSEKGESEYEKQTV